MLVCLGGKEKRSSSLFVYSLEWDMLFLQSRIPISVKRICQIRRVFWFDVSYRMVFWFFFLQHEFFFFFFITCLLFFPVVLLDNFLLINHRRLRCTIRLFRLPSENLSAADILYSDAFIREFIFSLIFLFRFFWFFSLFLDSASRLLTASFNCLLFSTFSIKYHNIRIFHRG